MQVGNILIKKIDLEIDRQNLEENIYMEALCNKLKADGGSRTPVTSLGSSGNSRYTTSAIVALHYIAQVN